MPRRRHKPSEQVPEPPRPLAPPRRGAASNRAVVPHPQPGAEPVREEVVGQPPALTVALFAETTVSLDSEEVEQAVAGAHLVVSLGHVDLEQLAVKLGPRKPALCILGPRDEFKQPPPPFRSLHAGGVNFRGWRIGGLSGALRHGPANGVYVSEDEAEALLENLPGCDILLTHAPPFGLGPDGGELGFEALGRYLAETPPLYHLYARTDESAADEFGATLSIGVCQVLVPPPLAWLD